MAAHVGIRDSTERWMTGASSSIARSGLPSARWIGGDPHLGLVAVLLADAVERGACANADLRELGARLGPMLADGLRARRLRLA